MFWEIGFPGSLWLFVVLLFFAFTFLWKKGKNKPCLNDLQMSQTTERDEVIFRNCRPIVFPGTPNPGLEAPEDTHFQSA